MREKEYQLLIFYGSFLDANYWKEISYILDSLNKCIIRMAITGFQSHYGLQLLKYE